MTDMAIFLRRAVNRLRPMSLQAAAASTRLLSPAIATTAPPAFSLPGEFDAVTGAVNGDIDLEWKRVTGAMNHHLPTIEYVLERVTLWDEYLFCRRYMGRLKTSRPQATAAAEVGRPVRVEHALLSTNFLSGLEFGHWVRDSLVTEMYGLDEGVPVVALAREPWPHEPDFRALSGLDCAYLPHATIDRLLFIDDRGHTDHWKQRFLQLRARMRGSIAALPGESAGPLVFLSRGANARTREPSNIEEIEAALMLLGFRTVIPSAMSAKDVGVALRDARLVVSAEGSNLNHLHFFAPDGVALVSLQDPNRFYAYHKGLMDCYDGRFGFVVGRPDPQEPGRHKIGIDRLKRTIDLVG